MKSSPWGEADLARVLDIYPDVRNAIHENNPRIIQLAGELGRGARAVEAQLLMFRALERGDYAWDKMSRLCRQLWDAKTREPEVDGGTFPMGLSDGLRRLQQKAFGGEHVATRPDFGDEEWWPRGPLHAGVEALLTSAIASIKGKEEGLSLFFLLGGAGNGKSFAARELLGRLGCIYGPNPDGTARRIYAMDFEDCQLIVLNDATIAMPGEYDGHQHIALAADLEAGWREARSKPTVFFCCVNRGIIIDEIRGLGRPGKEYPFGRAVLEWLDAGQSERFETSGFTLAGQGGLKSSEDQRYRHFEAHDPAKGTSVRIHALSVDISSLLEPYWEVEDLCKMTSGGGNPPRCTTLRGDRDKRSSAPAMTLARETLAKFIVQLEERPLHCPIRSNIGFLSKEDSLLQWTNALRAAEIAGGRLLSYRDIWGLISLSILGPRTPRNQGKPSVVDTVDELLRKLDSSTQILERAGILIELSMHRLHQAIFRAGIPRPARGGSHYPPGFPSAMGFSLIDPALDRTADSQAIESAMQAIPMGEKPSAFLFERRKDLGMHWSRFDGDLEDSLLAAIESEGLQESMRRELISWLGGYFCRYASMCTGQFGRDEVIADWHACAMKGKGEPLPVHLKKSIGGLLFPRLPNESEMAIRAFSPRSEAISRADGITRELLLESFDTSAVSLFVGKVGDRLTLQAKFEGRVISETALDFGLLREARLWDEGGAGGSESTRFVEPRIERARSACLGGLGTGDRGFHALIDGSIRELG